MTPILADEDFNMDAAQGARLRLPAIDIISISELGLKGMHDELVLELAAGEGRVVVSSDVSTMPVHATARVDSGRRMPGLFLAVSGIALRDLIEDLLLIAECSRRGEWEDQIRFLPMR